MNSPYMHRVFDHLARTLPIDLTLVSCVDREANRRWPVAKAESYTAHVLRGTWIRLTESRFAHINYGIWKTFNAAQPDLLIINGIYPSMVSARIWSSVNKVPLALYSDGDRFTMPNSPYHKVVRPWVFKKCRAVLCSSVKGEEFFAGAGFSPAAIFKWPLVPAWDAPAIIPNVEQRPFDILWCAHMNDTVKNVGFFADAVSGLKQRKPDLKVRIVGDGTSREAVLNRLRAADVEFVHEPFIPPQEMGKVFVSAKLFLLPSVYEPWGLVCNEAAQCGAVCIVSPFVGAADDLVLDGVNGRVLPLDVEQWIAAMQSLLDAPQLLSRYSRASQEAMRSRTLDAAADGFSRMIRYALGHT
jgi:glycosyltransferase involved in cell wall biosynthesis